MSDRRSAGPVLFLVLSAAIVFLSIGAVRKGSRNLAAAAEHERHAKFYAARAVDLMKSHPEESRLMGLRFRHHEALQKEYEAAVWKPWTSVKETPEPQPDQFVSNTS